MDNGGLVCRQVVELLTAYLDGALPVTEAAAVERHLAGCPDCSRYLDQLRTTIAATGQLPMPTIGPGTAAVLAAAFRGMLVSPDDARRRHADPQLRP